MAMEKMPVMFVRARVPDEAIEDNDYNSNWAKIARQMPCRLFGRGMS
jgi:aromatic ring-opening dioxygenase catalytic subunit (LigB family)